MAELLRDNPLSRFARGFFYPFRGGRFLLKTPRLWQYVLIPFLINTLVFSLAVWLGLDFFDTRIESMIPSGEGWYWLLLYYLLWVVAVLLTAILVFFSFTVVGNLIASPFNEILSERTEALVTGRAVSVRFSLREAWRVLVDESRKMLLFVIGMGLLLLLNLIPGFGTLVYSILSFFLTVYFLVIEYTGYVFSRKGQGFSEQRRFLRGRRFLALGFGVGVLCLLAIPFLQFFAIPLGVVGATLLWCDCRQEAADREEIS
ncbi:CysZ protein [Geothermobacter ehrlichii]|uniref:CysZ protein n=1 Tax=Geothermobacter ehrlichii TaxID=213224 RepID=A0A5D3WMW3_9BACT|nr:sulfate transporter CysZ [Geothermobacter ehrlichii]TYO99897.1 CysZ protein [Geothermobacter ehrlichii]